MGRLLERKRIPILRKRIDSFTGLHQWIAARFVNFT